MSNYCNYCGEFNCTNRCSGCNKVYYCDVVCQTTDWSEHKRQCKNWRKQNEPQQNKPKINKQSKDSKLKSQRIFNKYQKAFQTAIKRDNPKATPKPTKQKPSNPSTINQPIINQNPIDAATIPYNQSNKPQKAETKQCNDSETICSIQLSREEHKNIIESCINIIFTETIYDEIYSFITGYKQTIKLMNKNRILMIDIHTMSYYENIIRNIQLKHKINPYGIHVVYHGEDPEFTQTIGVCVTFYDAGSFEQKNYPLITLKKYDVINKRNNTLNISYQNLAELIKISLDMFDLIYVGCNTIGISSNVTKDIQFKINVVRHAREIIMPLIMENPDLRLNGTDNDTFGISNAMNDVIDDICGPKQAPVVKEMYNIMNESVLKQKNQMMQCGNCNKKKWNQKRSEKSNGLLRKCKQCQIVFYCSRKCQKYHWKYNHHRQCKLS